MAKSALGEIYIKDGGDIQARQEVARSILRELSFDETGYIFVYKYDGINLVTRPKPQLEGKNLIDLKDSDGKPLLRELISAARSGGGVVRYKWEKPNTKKVEDKLSYATSLDKWQWMLGTGFCIDDIDSEVAAIADSVEASIRERIAYAAVTALILVLLGIGLSSLLARKISGPLLEASTALDEISSGDGDLTRHLVVNSHDEVGRLADGFNRVRK
ncbi:MAG: HAMP domain-containing protein [Gammaproteobacteria bacterium]|nr:HAMP domain-containing protein [Gammaproteobacteria bacterium]